MDRNRFLADQFDQYRCYLKSVAYRILGSRTEADDAVQESFLRLMRTEAGEVANLRGWLTTVVAHVCLDSLRARKARREEPMGRDAELTPTAESAERDAELADAVGIGMLVVLETLAPAERVAFVLHDMFDVPFDQIAPIIRRSPMATRQLASRARRRMQGNHTSIEADRERQREVISAFLAASRGGDFSALLALLAPDAVLRADVAAVEASRHAGAGAPQLANEIHGHEAIAEIFRGRAQAARIAFIDDNACAVFAPGGVTRVVFDFTVEDERILEICLIADPARIATLNLRM